jgi:dethiobiotin synthetase
MKPIRNKSFGQSMMTFITATDTGAGKTLLTALLLVFLREKHELALAVKPFCTGSLEDYQLFNALQNQALTAEEACPFFFPEPAAPLVAARKHRQSIALSDVIARIKDQALHCEHLLVEGIGGIMVPLGEGYSVLDLMVGLGAPVIVVARNQLGILNHTLLTAKVLHDAGIQNVLYVLMGTKQRNFATRTNERILVELLAPDPVFSLPYFGDHLDQPGAIRSILKRAKGVLARIVKPRAACG